MKQSTSPLFFLLLLLISVSVAYKDYSSGRSRQAVGYTIENGKHLLGALINLFFSSSETPLLSVQSTVRL